jgi:hypothetical protein
MNSCSSSIAERRGTPAQVSNSVFDKPTSSVFARWASSARSARRALEQAFAKSPVGQITRKVSLPQTPRDQRRTFLIYKKVLVLGPCIEMPQAV